MKSFSEKRADGNIWRQIIFWNIDVRVSLEAWEYEYDEELSSAPLGDVELEGECVMEDDLDILEAIKKFAELMNKGWQVIELTIRPREKQPDVDFLIQIRNHVKRGITVTISVNETELNKELAEKIRKIEEIIKG